MAKLMTYALYSLPLGYVKWGGAVEGLEGFRKTRRTRRTTKVHEEMSGWETADYADWSRLGAGYRRQDCQIVLEITKDTVQARSDKPSTAKDTKVFG